MDKRHLILIFGLILLLCIAWGCNQQAPNTGDNTPADGARGTPLPAITGTEGIPASPAEPGASPIGSPAASATGTPITSSTDMHTMAAASPVPANAPLTGSVVNGVREINVQAKRYAFIPDPIVVKKGEKVKITATTLDVEHGFSVREYNIKQEIKPGKPTVIQFTADKAGTFTVHCTVYCGPGHRDMKGTLVVKE